MYIETYNNHKIESQVQNMGSYLSGIVGIIIGYGNSGAVTFSAPYTVKVASGLAVICGKNIVIEGDSVTVTATTSTQVWDIYLVVDMFANTVTLESYLPTTTQPYPTHYGQNDIFINNTSGSYWLKVAEATTDSTGIISVEEYSSTYIEKGAGDVKSVYPVGKVLYFANGTDPNTIWDDTTWVQVTAGNYITTGANESEKYTGTPLTMPWSTSITSNAFTLTVAHLPAHAHSVTAHTHTGVSHDHSSVSHNHSFGSNVIYGGGTWYANSESGTGGPNTVWTTSKTDISNDPDPGTGNGGTNNTGGPSANSNAANNTNAVTSTGGGQSHTHTYNLNVYCVSAWERVE